MRLFLIPSFVLLPPLLCICKNKHNTGRYFLQADLGFPTLASRSKREENVTFIRQNGRSILQTFSKQQHQLTVVSMLRSTLHLLLLATVLVLVIGTGEAAPKGGGRGGGGGRGRGSRGGT